MEGPRWALCTSFYLINIILEPVFALAVPHHGPHFHMVLESKYCSWCHLASAHQLVKENRVSRNVYACGNCGQHTLVCLVPGCKHMARTGSVWDDNLCAEHDGRVPNLSAWVKELEDIEEFRDVCRRASTNFLTLPEPFRPRKIKRLLSPIDDDFFALDHFAIRKVQEGSKHAVIFVNGFLSQGETDISDWTDSTRRYFGKATWYHLHWDATRHPKRVLSDNLSTSLFSSLLITTVPNQPTRFIDKVFDGVTAWHLSMRNAEIAGRLLANAITRTPDWRFTLAGHSLGGRVVHFALRALAEQPKKRIDNAYLLGAAVGGGAKDDECWSKAASAVRGHIVNCYSLEDEVLQKLYRGANVMISQPAGYSGIHLDHDKILDFDCTELVKSHTSWKREFGEIIRQSKQHL